MFTPAGFPAQDVAWDHEDVVRLIVCEGTDPEVAEVVVRTTNDALISTSPAGAGGRVKCINAQSTSDEWIVAVGAGAVLGVVELR